MNNKNKSNQKNIDIDELLQETWLRVISLQHKPEFKSGEGRKFWQACVDDINHVQQVLTDADFSQEDCAHILYAQCAILDEAVKKRTNQDDAHIQWYDMPLQGHFLGTIDAGEKLYDRVRELLRDPTSNTDVLTCFQRVLMLGFVGSYDSIEHPEREKLTQALNERVPAFHTTQTKAVYSGKPKSFWLQSLMSSWLVRLSFGFLFLAVLWWGLDHWLLQELTRLLPEL